jgi:Mg/Co/Ni transporter MgtE
MASVNRVYVARLARMLVLGPMGENFGRVRDVVISISIVRQQPRVLGLVVDLATRRSIFIPILRVAAIEPNAVTLNTGSVSLRHFEQRPGEVLAIGQILDTQVTVNDPEFPDLAGREVMITDLGIEQSRTRDWLVTRIAVRTHRRLGRRGPVHVVDWQSVHGLTPSALAMPGQAVAQLLNQFEGRRAVDVADAIRGLPLKRRTEVFQALTDERLADILQELPESEQADALSQLGTERAADVLEEMDPDDAADLLGELNPTDAELLLARMDPDESAPVRRLLKHSPDTAGGLMTSDPVVLTADTTVAEALALVRNPDLTPALSSMVFVARPPTATPTGRYLGCVPLQRLLREPPSELVGGIVDSDLLALTPETTLAAVTRYFAAYNLVCGPVVDEEKHLLGAVTVDDVLDHLLPHDWRARPEDPDLSDTGDALDVSNPRPGGRS